MDWRGPGSAFSLKQIPGTVPVLLKNMWDDVSRKRRWEIAINFPEAFGICKTCTVAGLGLVAKIAGLWCVTELVS